MILSRLRSLVRKVPIAVFAGGMAALLGAGAVGYLGGQKQVIDKINQRYVQPALASFEPPADDALITWETINTQFLALQVARIDLAVDALPALMAIEEVGGDILFASRLGQFGYLDKASHIHRLEGLQIDSGLEELTKSPLYQNPIFVLGELRTIDLLSVPAGEDAFDLYVSHIRFRNDCFELVVSRTRLIRDPERLYAEQAGWEEIYVTEPCIPPKEIDAPFAGHEGGGRLVRHDPNTLLLSIGVFQFDGLHGPFQAGQDDANDLGKIVEISTLTGKHEIYARGFRNPQGLMVDSDGRVWETEHGPSGGDEVNLILRDANYGWPIVSYGTNYGEYTWPFNPDPAQHRGYERPRFAFVPSIGISNLIEPSTVEFPAWGEHLLVTSLNGATLFALKTEGDDITYAEPIKLGERLRDIISLSDGRMAIITDTGVLMLLRNAAGREMSDSSFVVTGLSNRLQPSAEEIAKTDTPEILGIRAFFYYCSSCHSVNGEASVGPPLNGVLGRDIASVEGFAYSNTLDKMPGRWTPARMRGLLEQSDPRFDGTTMSKMKIQDWEFDAMMVYLRQTEKTPAEP